MGRRSCTSCGAAVPSRPASCPYCGAALAQPAALDVPRWASRNWGVLLVTLGALDIALDVLLGRHRESGVGLVVLVLTWLLWWGLVVVTVAAVLVRRRARRSG